MNLRDGLNNILSNYLAATSSPVTRHPVAQFLRRDLRDIVAAASGQPDRYVFKGSAGQGNWVKGPWVGVFNPMITQSAQSGYYACYLFREDLGGVYLSLNQGMTEAKSLYHSDAKSALRARAINFRALLGNGISDLVQVIDLKPTDPGNDTAFYEAGNVCGYFYAKGSLPDNEVLEQNLSRILTLYEQLISAESNAQLSVTEVDGDAPSTETEDTTKLRVHKRIERNKRLAKKVKAAKGCICEICGLDFSKRYGPLGAGFIEAHHLRPLASLASGKIELSPITDFAVLCSNCHRMVHRSDFISDMVAFKKAHYYG